jgi:hypothetical protein
MRSVLVLAALATAVPTHAFAGGRSASMGVSATVQRSAVFRMNDSFQQLSSSNIDFSKGYVDLPGTIQILVNSGASTRRVLNVTVEVEPNPELVRSIQMRARTDDATQLAGAQAPKDEPQNIALGYRVLLTDRAKAGDFSVPVTLTVNL